MTDVHSAALAPPGRGAGNPPFPFPAGGLGAALVLVLLLVAPAAAQEGQAAGAHGPPASLLWIALILVAAKASSLVERLGQPAVLGELLVGVLIGNLTLVGVGLFAPATADPILVFLAELGVIVLLFQIGLESDLGQLRRVGVRAVAVAVIGVVLPFALGTWAVGPYLLPGLGFNAYLFVGAALTATSVGITARVFRDLGGLHTQEAQTVLGAAVIDDVLGLVILAVVSAIATAGSITAVTVGTILVKAVLFLVGAVVVGQLLAPHLGRLFSRIHTGSGMKFTLAIAVALLFAYTAGFIGLAPIVGAFAAGLVMEPVHFAEFEAPRVVAEVRESLARSTDPETRDRVLAVMDLHTRRHIDDLVEPLGHFLVPIFFVVTGMSVDLRTLSDPATLGIALAVTAVAVVGKLAAGLAAGPVRRWMVGWGMVPRGEVGLIFATTARQLDVLPEREFSIIVIMVVLTTLMTPPILSLMLREPRVAAHAGRQG